MRSLRDDLIEDGTYLGDPDLNVRHAFQWVQFEKGRILCTTQVARAYDEAFAAYKDDVVAAEPPPAPTAANLSGVYRIDESLFFMTADGNWNPKSDYGGFDESKATCLLAAPSESFFAKDFELANRNIHTIVKMGLSGDNRPLKGIFNDTDDGRRLLKLRHVLFEANDESVAKDGSVDDDEKTDSIDGDDESLDIDEVLEVTANGGRPLTKAEQLEFFIKGWPVKKRAAKEEMLSMVKTHQVTPIIAFDIIGDRILPSTYEARLKGADVKVHFNMMHWAFGNSKKPATLSDTIVADLANMRVIVPDVFTPQIGIKRVRKL
ncbi:hypothetical protein EW026_g7657 [Hermanssonia centrifuga]|uniref:Uncharacterized protein n=1 Tax=Hermanssonia centrifuga TaxID=98765 RepID=A0A4V3X9C4_9APHY|nr:hypothetical protein EW026_g7657 [Hermanssonia centrifuga]